jgi:hypothetical protein
MPTPEPVTISFAHPHPDTDHYQRLLELFNERYPYITVELQPTYGYGPGVQADDADVLAAPQSQANLLYEQGHLLSLTAFIEQGASDGEPLDLDGFYPDSIEFFSR